MANLDLGRAEAISLACLEPRPVRSASTSGKRAPSTSNNLSTLEAALSNSPINLLAPLPASPLEKMRPTPAVARSIGTPIAVSIPRRLVISPISTS